MKEEMIFDMIIGTFAYFIAFMFYDAYAFLSVSFKDGGDKRTPKSSSRPRSGKGFIKVGYGHFYGLHPG